MKFYYLRDSENRRVVTVFIAQGRSKAYYRGISICSRRDPFCKVTGKNKAEGRAIKAMTNRETELPISVAMLEDVRSRGINLIGDGIAPFKSAYNITPNEYERKLLGEGMSDG